MDSLLPTIIITAINIIGWIYTRVYALGKLNEKVARHDKLLDNGIVKELNDLKNQVACLDGTVKTYIKLTSSGD